MKHYNEIKNAAGLGYIQGRLKELIEVRHLEKAIDLTIDGFYGPATREAFKVLFDGKPNINLLQGEHNEGIMVFQICYNNYVSSNRNGLFTISADGRWGENTLNAFHIALEEALKKPLSVSEMQNRVRDDLVVITEENSDIRLLTSTPFNRKSVYDELMVLLTGVEGVTVEGLVSIKQFPLVYTVEGIPVAAALLCKDYGGSDNVYVSNIVISKTVDIEKFIKKAFDITKIWAAREMYWKVPASIYQGIIESNLKEAGFIKNLEQPTFVEYMSVMNSN